MKHDAPLPSLIAIGILSALFFSATFVLNYTMHLAGGNWLWSAIGRYLFMIVLLIALIAVRDGWSTTKDVFRIFFQNLVFWFVAGTIGFGIFYAGICFAADYSRGWVVAATWQSTVLFSPFVLLAFGFKFPARGILISLGIFVGVLLVNHKGLESGIGSDEIIFGVLPVLLAAVAYPVGNQLLNAAKNDTLRFVPHISSPIMSKSTCCVLLMSLGSVPFWLILFLTIQPPAPSTNQLLSTLVVALSSGVIATGLFLHARNLTSSPYKIAAVDATLAAEVAFTLIAELLFMGLPVPDTLSTVGLTVITLGLVAYCFKTS